MPAIAGMLRLAVTGDLLTHHLEAKYEGVADLPTSTWGQSTAVPLRAGMTERRKRT